jgi:molybdenum cofactor cytidylyltransferase
MRRLAGLVLAAGSSTRMGPDRNKLVEEVAGRALIEWPVDALLDAGAAPVVVVTGHDEEALREALHGRAVHFVHHEGWSAGMGGSIARGARELLAVAPDCEGVLVSVGDLPGLRLEHIAPVAQAFEAASPDAICIPVFGGRRGHPVLFGGNHLAELAELSGESGARALFERHSDALIEVEVASDAILCDVDTPEALMAARRQMPGM